MNFSDPPLVAPRLLTGVTVLASLAAALLLISGCGASAETQSASPPAAPVSTGPVGAARPAMVNMMRKAFRSPGAASPRKTFSGRPRYFQRQG